MAASPRTKAYDKGFTSGTVAALAVVALFDQETTWWEILRCAGQEAVIYHAAHVEPDDWSWAGFDKYNCTKPPKITRRKKD